MRLLAKIKRSFSANIIVIRLDNERRYSELLYVLRDLSIVVEPRAEYTKEQNS
jgi:hypothetical protein